MWLIALTMAAIWITAILVVLGLCVSAARGDAQLTSPAAGTVKPLLRLLA